MKSTPRRDRIDDLRNEMETGQDHGYPYLPPPTLNRRLRAGFVVQAEIDHYRRRRARAAQS